MPELTKEEKTFIAQNYGTMTASQIGKLLGGRSKDTIQWHARKLGVTDKSTQKEQPCSSCQNACGGCSWSHNFTPVKGWKAKPSTIYEGGYFIQKCPEFVPDPPRYSPALEVAQKPKKATYDSERLLYMLAKHWTHDEIARAFNVSVRTIKRWVKNERTGKTLERRTG